MSEEKQRRSQFHKLQKIDQDVAGAAHPLTLTQVNLFLEQANEIMGKLEAIQDTIICICVDEAAETVQNNEFDRILTLYRKVRVNLTDQREALIAANPVHIPEEPAPDTTRNVRLPAMELPTFTGTYKTWTSFQDLFKSSIESNRNLTEAQKLQYLKSAVKDEPAALIRSLQITNANYQEAWEILNERYDNKREIVFSLLRRLFGPKALQYESVTELQKLLDNTNECIRTLKQFNCPVEQWDCILVYHISNKFDSNTRREWAKSLRGTELPTFKQLAEFLVDHIRGLQAGGQGKQQGRQFGNKQVSSHHAAPSTNAKCSSCSGNHFLSKCPTFLAKSSGERGEVVKENKLCFNCFGRHRSIECKSNYKCKTCNKKHHSLLHNEKFGQLEKKIEELPGPSSQPSVFSNHYAATSNQVLLSTAVVKVKSRSNGIQLVRIFLDSGSEGTFITEDCATRLGLKRHPSNVLVKGISVTAAGTTKGMIKCTLISRLTNEEFPITAHILQRVTGELPRTKCKIQEWIHMQGLTLADPQYHVPRPIDILVGNNYVNHILKNERRLGSINEPVAQDSIFGWIVSGNIGSTSSHHLSIHHAEVDIEDVIQRFWQVEEPPHVRFFTKEEKAFEENFVKGHSRNHDGKFIVPLPFNDKLKQLGASRTTAVRRFLQVERRLNRNPQFKEPYIKFMREYLSLGHMEEISENEEKEVIGKTYHLPHHFVENEDSSTTKFRVVFDGSAQSSSGISLNDTLLVGATVQDNMFDIVLRVRLHAVVLKGDMVKMFRMFLVPIEHADFQRIVWRESPKDPIKDYRLLTVTYGTGCATNVAARCVKQLAQDIKKEFPLASKALKEDTYVDDVTTGERNTQETITLYQHLTLATRSASLELRKWATNDPIVLQSIPEETPESGVQEFDKEQTIKTLGIHWNPSTDTFGFNSYDPKNYENYTKRIVLSDLARVFDPIGLLAAVTVVAKLIMQEIWTRGVTWDETLPEDICEKWTVYADQLKLIRQLQVPRRITIENATLYELIGFSDASERAYGCIVYLRAHHQDGNCKVSFVTAKTKVAPIKQITLARLELCAAVMVSKLIYHVKNSLKLNCNMYLFTDSTIVNRWIVSSPRRWQTYVANRVAVIQEHTDVENWRHVPGIQNPADLVSRGIPAAELIENKFYWNGPEWLQRKEFPVFKTNKDVVGDLEERKPTLSANPVIVDVSLITRFSSYNKLVRVTALLYRFCNLCKRPVVRNGPISVAELNHARVVCVRLVQSVSYPKELTNILCSKPISASSKLLPLNPFADSDGILRVGGRLQKANIIESTMHPIILPADNHLTMLIISSTHLTQLHSGFQLTWSTLRRQYWIIGGRDKVRHYIRKCVTCIRYRSQASQQLMAPLPSVRVNPARPFINSGVDYAGPFYVANSKGRKCIKYKSYMCIFVCMITKAIHLELVSDLSTAAFIATFRRFVSRRGLCANLYSDNGTNFVGADKELRRLFKSQQHNSSVFHTLAAEGVQFHFNSPSSPHHGGLWEAGVKSAKYH